MKITGLLLGLATLSSVAMAHENGSIKIYDAQFVSQKKLSSKLGILVLEDGEKKSVMVSESARILNENLEKTRDFFAAEFNRKSWDNKGADIRASINANRLAIFDTEQIKENASWFKDRLIFGAGKKDGFDNWEMALDVVAHEFTHAVVQSTSKLAMRGQSGALNEHFCDVFGSIINQVNNPKLSNPYRLGSTILFGKYAQKAKSLRDMMDPSKGLTPQPAHMQELQKGRFYKYGDTCKKPNNSNDKCGVHILSGIPNKVAALVMSAIGPQEAAKLFYPVMTKRLTESSKFSDYSAALREECKSMSTDTCGIVNDALLAVGL